MSRVIRLLSATMVALALFALAAFIGTPAARAQSCPGGTLQVQNQTGCNVVVELNAVPPVAPFAVAPGATVFIAVAPGTVINSIKSIGGINYPFPPIPPEPACTGAFKIRPAGCCVRACLFPHNCILQIKPAPAPCGP